MSVVPSYRAMMPTLALALRMAFMISGESMQVMVDRINEINDRAKELSEDMRRSVTVAELAQETEISEDEIRQAMRMAGGQIEGLVP